MIVETNRIEKWVDPAEVRELFEGVAVAKEVEIDDELGLEVVAKETIESKYGVPKPDPKNDFHRSLIEQFELRGHLSPKQVNCLRNPRY